MSDSDWRKHASPRRLAAATFALGLVLWCAVALIQYRGEHASQRNDTAQNYANDGFEQRPTLCAHIPRLGIYSCSVDVAQADPDASEARRSYYDLQAQQEMAEWAFVVMLATIAGVLTTIVGLVYVVRAYRLNADATDHARITAEAAEKTFAVSSRPHILPIVSLKIEDPQAINERETLYQMRYTIVLANFGNGLARITDVKIEHSFGITPTFEYDKSASGLLWRGQSRLVEAKERVSTGTIGTGVQFDHDQYMGHVNGTRPALVFGEILYRDAILLTSYRRVFCFGPSRVNEKRVSYDALVEWGGRKYNYEEVLTESD